MTAALGSRFWRLYAATASSDLADGVGRAALPLAMATYTRNPVAVAGITSFTFLPWLLLALPSGALVDRSDRRTAMAVANAVRAGAAALLAGAVLTGWAGAWLLYVVAFAFGAAETVYDSALRALLPQLVRADQLDRANSLATVEETVGQTFAGAPLGAALFGVAVGLPFLLNAVGFAVAVLVIAGLRGSYRPRSTPAAEGPQRRAVRDGVRWLYHHRLLRGLTLVSAGTAGTQAMATSILVLYVLQVLRLPGSDYGLLLLVAGIGAAIGGLATPPLTRRLGRPFMLTAGGVISAAGVGAMALTRNGYVAALLFALCSSAVMIWNVLTMSLRQALIPQHLFGRVQGAYRTLVWGAIPLGSLLGGALAGAFGIRAVFALAGLLSFAMAIALGLIVHRHAEAISGDLAEAAELVNA